MKVLALLGLGLAVGCSGGQSSGPVRVHVPEVGTQTIDANGIEFHYFEEGTGPLVLLVHGFPDTAHTWDDLRPAIAGAGFRAVSPFMRGYAPTDAPEGDVTAEMMGRDVLALIEAFGEDSAIVIGHDWGAEHVYAAAHLEPARIERMMTVGIPHRSTLKITPSILWSGRHFVSLNRAGAPDWMPNNDFEHVDELYARWAPTWDVPDEELEPIKNAFAVPESLNAALGYYRGNTSSVPEFMSETIAVPTVLVGGTDDLLPESAFTVDSRAAFSGEYRVEMLPGGHFVHRESPEAFEELVLRDWPSFI